MATRIITNIPSDEVDAIVDLLKTAGATKVQKLIEPDKEFTVIALFADAERFSDIAARRDATSTA